MHKAAELQCDYYLQLEDDIPTISKYVSRILDFTKKRPNKDWLVIHFSKIGFAGKLFQHRDLNDVSIFLKKFYWIQPADWLLDLLEILYCDHVKRKRIQNPPCRTFGGKVALHYPSQLFIHKGLNSSRGKWNVEFGVRKSSRNKNLWSTLHYRSSFSQRQFQFWAET